MPETRNGARTRILLLLGGALALPFAAPGAAHAQSDRTLLKSDLVRMMTGDSYSAEEVLQIVRMNCVGFAPSERDRKDLSRLFESEELVDEIDRCREVGHGAGYRRGLPVAREATSVEEVPDAPRAQGPVLAPTGSAGRGIEPPALARPPIGSVAPVDTLPGVLPSVPPKLLNWSTVTDRILAEYRPDRRNSGEVVLRIRVDAEGNAGEATILDASGDPALAKVALSAVPLMRFSPATSRDRKVAAWATLPIRFRAD